MIWQKIGNSVSDGLFRDSVRDSVIAEISLFISCSIILSFKFKNSTFLLFPKHFSFCFYVLRFWQTDFIFKKRRIFFVEQGIVY